MKPIVQYLSGVTLALVSGLAVAAPKDELHEAFTKFLQAKSFRAEIVDADKGRIVSTMEFVAPDRYRMKIPQGPAQIIVGDAMYTEINGKMMRLPVPGVGKITSQYRNEEFLREAESDMTVQALPDGEVDGEPAKVYAYTVTKPTKADAKVWISRSSGLPLQIESSGTYMGKHSKTLLRYSSFDDPSIRIAEPD